MTSLTSGFSPGFDGHTALVVVDVQNDFADVHGNLFVEGGDVVVPVINELVGAAHAAGAWVVYTQDWHPASTPHFEKDGGVWPTHCVAGTWGAQLHPELHVVGPVVRKGVGGEDGYSGFGALNVATGEVKPTQLHAWLQEHRVARLVVVGLARDVCVKETALDARSLGFDTVVVTGATRAVDRHPGDGERALEELRVQGVQVC